MKATAIATLFALIFLSCNSNPKNFSQELGGENLIKLELANLNISMLVPQTHSIVERDDKAVINLNPNGRAVKQFSITKSKAVSQKDIYTENLLFDNGALLNYRLFDEAGGNGGIEYKLEGVLTFEKERYLITATDQKEAIKGNPEFCLKYLSTISSLNNQK